MANTITKSVMVDGTRVHASHVYLASDGSSGELTDSVVIDVSALAVPTDHVRIRRVYGLMSGFALTLEFDASTDQAFLTFPDGVYTYMDLTPYGGLEDPEASGTTGDIVGTTSGFTASGDVGWLVIEVEKLPS